MNVFHKKPLAKKFAASSLTLFFVLLFCGIHVGCSDSRPTARVKTEKKENGLKPGFTNEIGEFNADDGKAVVDSKVKYSNPITGALEAYDPIKQQLAEGHITKAVEMFRATEGRYPKDFEEFKRRVIDENGLPLPKLGVGKRYEYDVANHKLMVVMDSKKVSLASSRLAMPTTAMSIRPTVNQKAGNVGQKRFHNVDSRFRQIGPGKRVVHQLYPPIPGSLIDRKWSVTPAKFGVPSLFDIGLWPTETKDQKSPEAFFSTSEIVSRVHRPKNIIVRNLMIKRGNEPSKTIVADDAVDLILCKC